MITTSFLILKYALSKTGIIIVGEAEWDVMSLPYRKYDRVLFEKSDHELLHYDDNYLFHDWNGTQKETLCLYQGPQCTFYHNNGSKSFQFVPNTPLGRGLALNYITFKEQKKLASMAKQLTTEGEPFEFPWGVGIKKAQDAKRFIINVGNLEEE